MYLKVPIGVPSRGRELVHSERSPRLAALCHRELQLLDLGLLLLLAEAHVLERLRVAAIAPRMQPRAVSWSWQCRGKRVHGSFCLV